MALRLLIAFLLVVPLSRADDFQAETAVSTTVGLSRKWAVALRARSRIRPSEKEFADISLIPILGYQVRRNVLIYFGNFFTRRNLRGVGTSTLFRPIAGIEPKLVRERFTLAFRSGYERLMIVRAPDFNRYRQRFQISGNGTWSPYANVELFFVDQGYSKTRYGAGVERAIGNNHAVNFGYWFESRKFIENRHMISVTFNLNFKGWAPDF